MIDCPTYKQALAKFVDTFRKLGVTEEDLMQGLWDQADVIGAKLDEPSSANYPTNPEVDLANG